MSTKFKITFNVVFSNHSMYIGGLETFLLLWSSGARLHAFGVSTSTSSNSKCCSRGFNINRVVITYYGSGVFFSDVAVCMMIPGFKISKVYYYSVVFLNLLPPVQTCKFKCQMAVATSFPVSLFSTVSVFHTV